MLNTRKDNLAGSSLRGNQHRQEEPESIVLWLAYRPPMDVGALLDFVGRRAIPGVEEVCDGRYRRTIALDGTTGLLEVTPDPGNHQVMLSTSLSDIRGLAPLMQRVRALFDLDVDPSLVGAVLSADDTLAPLVAQRPGLRVPGAIDGFELAVRAILGQQVSVGRAQALAGELVQRAGEPLHEPSGSLTHRFPTPDALLRVSLDRLGVPTIRSDAIRHLARAVIEGRVSLTPAADRERTYQKLRAIPGVGPWTASYIGMRALRDCDAFPAGDAGLRRALEQAGASADTTAVVHRAEGWRPWRAYAVMHLWSSLGTP